MNKLYQKSPLAFALVWIGVYVIGFSLADNLSVMLDTEKLVTLPLCAVLTVFLLRWISQNNLSKAFSLHKPSIPAASLLWYLPLALIVTTNLWGGVAWKLSILETVLTMLTMVGVGILEELIFRGMLFRAMAKDNLKAAVLVSSLTFGLGHIVNLLNGAPFLDTLLQVCYAAAIGFLFTILFLKTGSLLPCILTHSMVNALSAISGPRSSLLDLTAALFLIAVPLLYAFGIIKKHPS